MVRHTLTEIRSRLGCADVHATVECHGIHGNDLRLELLSKLDAEFTLAAASRPGQDKGFAEGTGEHTRYRSRIRQNSGGVANPNSRECGYAQGHTRNCTVIGTCS